MVAAGIVAFVPVEDVTSKVVVMPRLAMARLVVPLPPLGASHTATLLLPLSHVTTSPSEAPELVGDARAIRAVVTGVALYTLDALAALSLPSAPSLPSLPAVTGHVPARTRHYPQRRCHRRRLSPRQSCEYQPS